MTNVERIDIIRDKLQQALKPTKLEIADESYQHHGHAGAQTGAGHFAITVASPLFAGQAKVACHRLIYAALDTMIPTEIHALQINIYYE
jgi:BolA family transcriptional regulator, general stress-responsive regulator